MSELTDKDYLNHLADELLGGPHCEQYGGVRLTEKFVELAAARLRKIAGDLPDEFERIGRQDMSARTGKFG